MILSLPPVKGKNALLALADPIEFEVMEELDGLVVELVIKRRCGHSLALPSENIEVNAKFMTTVFAPQIKTRDRLLKYYFFFYNDIVTRAE